MSKHTPGPWLVETAPHGAFDIIKDPNDLGRYMVIAGRGSHEVRADEMHANARLMAAAPDLLAALKTAEAILYAHDKPVDPAITAAIAKAVGDA